jgi:macrolide phosphotransferase
MGFFTGALAVPAGPGHGHGYRPGEPARGPDLEVAFELAQESWHGRPLLRRTARLVDEAGGFAVLQVADDAQREWVFRYPLTAPAGVALERELRLLDVLARRLPAPVPQPVTLGVLPGGDYLFAGYPRLRGAPCLRDVLLGRRGGLLVSQLAGFLTVLHDTRHADVVSAGVPHRAGAAWRLEQAQLLDRARRRLPLPPALLHRWGAAFRDDARWPDELGLTHGNLDPRHVLVDRERALLGGVVEWGQARMGDPAADLGDLRAGCGPEALEEVLAAYFAAREEPVDAGFRERVRFHASVRAVRTALYGLDTDQDAVVRIGLATLETLG